MLREKKDDAKNGKHRREKRDTTKEITVLRNLELNVVKKEKREAREKER